MIKKSLKYKKAYLVKKLLKITTLTKIHFLINNQILNNKINKEPQYLF